MTKQEQIAEMAVIGCVRNPQAHTAEECAKCDFKQGQCNAYRHAEELYNAGYRKVEGLEKGNADLLKACEEQFTFDTTENRTYSIFNSVRKVFADEVKAKLFAIFGKTMCNDLDTEDITDIIDELLKEYE